MKQRLIDALKKAWRTEHSSQQLAGAVGMGVYIAFCPFIGLHTVLTFALSWLLRLNPIIVLGVSWIINNPWTMGPVYMIGYVAGVGICKWLHIDLYLYNPDWIDWINNYIQHYTGLQGVSLLAWLIGGNVLGAVFGIICYIGTLYVIHIRRKKIDV